MPANASSPNAPIVVVGAGAAGALAAIFAAGSGRRVVLLERTKDGGRKILISGEGAATSFRRISTRRGS